MTRRRETAAGPGAAGPFYLLAFFSGMAALVYQVAWSQMLALTFGSTTLAASAVIAGLLGGMGLGAAGYRYAHARFPRPLPLYCGIEVGIALSAALLTLGLYRLPELFARISESAGSGLALDALRLLVVFGLVLVPAALMGATFPALCSVVIHTATGVDRRLGSIYGINTLGAAAGAGLAGLVLIERLGLTGAVHVANGINLAVAAAAYALVRRATEPGPRQVAPHELALPTTLPRWVTGVALAGSAVATLGYEIVWFRALRYLVGNSTYALSIVLVVFLAGLGIGAVLLPRVVRRGPERQLALNQCFICLASLWAIVALHTSLAWPAVYEQVSIFRAAVHARPWELRVLADSLLAVATLLPATICMGISFPLASRLFLGDVRALDRRLGGAYLLANLGSIAGAIGGATLLLPGLGTVGATRLLAALNLALAVTLAWVQRRTVRPPLLAVAGGALALVAACLALPASLPLAGEDLLPGVPGIVTSRRESDLATVQVKQHPLKPDQRCMQINGYGIGWSEGLRSHAGYRKQVLLAHLPLVIDPRIRRTLNVGLGSASTLHALAGYPQVERLDCVEINAAVVAAARESFPDSAVLADPRVRLVVDDAVHYLLRSPDTYDLIVSDGKQDPFSPANAALLSREFYRFASRRLSDDGLFVQWMPLPSLEEDVAANLRTLCEVFPQVEVFHAPLNDLFFVAAKRPLAARPRLSDERFRTLPVARDLAAYNLDRPQALLARWVCGKPQLAAVLPPGPSSTWDRPLLDFSPFKARREQWIAAAPTNLRRLVEAGERPRSDLPFPPGDDPVWRSTALVRRAVIEYLGGNALQARRLAEQAVEADPADREARTLLGFFSR